MSKYQSHNYCVLVTTPKPKIVPVKITPRVSTFLTDEDLLRVTKTPISAYMIGVMVKRSTGKTPHPDDIHTRLKTLVHAGSMIRSLLRSKNAPAHIIVQKVVYQAKIFGEK